MIIWAEGTVAEVLEDGEELQRLVVEESATGKRRRAVHYPPLLGRAEPGDGVWLNTTAVHLGLGSGGADYVAGWRSRRPQSPPVKGHIMKLRYTPWQMAVLSGEEQVSRHHPVMKEARSLEGAPVLLGELHSMLPVAAATWRALAAEAGESPRIVYVMTDGGALPLACSGHVRRLTEAGWIDATVTAGHAFGGALEGVNLYSSLLLARHALEADLIFVSMGPGIVGTGTPFGFSGVEQGQAVNAVRSLAGVPVFIPRIQGADTRERHRGISHHTRTNLASVALAPAVVAYPSEPETVGREVASLQGECPVAHEWIPMPISLADTKKWLGRLPEPVTTMGRGIGEDPLFYRTVCAGAETAYRLWRLSRAADTGG